LFKIDKFQILKKSNEGVAVTTYKHSEQKQETINLQEQQLQMEN